MKILSAPLSLCFGITNKCNLSCKHCLASSQMATREFTREKLDDIIRQIAEMKIFNVAIFGGEPLCSEYFHHVVEQLTREKISVSLNSNATLITREEAEWLAKQKVRSYTISLDGSCASVHDPFRGDGSFDAAVQGIEHLVRAKRNITMSVIVTKYNFRDLDRITQLGRKLGVRHVRFNNVCYVGSAVCNARAIRMTPDEIFESIELARAVRTTFGDFVSGSHLQQIDIMDDLRGKRPAFTFPLRVDPCGAAMKQCTIRPDGKVVPCEIIWDAVAGDLYEQPLREIWLHSPVMKSFRAPTMINADEIPECVTCEWLRLCYLGHRCQPYYNPGKFANKELYCINKEVVRS